MTHFLKMYIYILHIGEQVYTRYMTLVQGLNGQENRYQAIQIRKC